MKEPKIESGIAIPRKNSRFNWIEFLSKLKQGNSFLTHKISAVKKAAYESNIKLTIRHIQGKEYRVWRIQ